MKNRAVIFLSIVFFINVVGYVFAQAKSPDSPVLEIFYSPTCHSCIKVKSKIMPKIEEEFRDKIVIKYRNIEEIDSFRLLLGLKEKHSIELSDDLPVFYCNGKFLNGEENIGKEWKVFILSSLQEVEALKADDLPQVDLVSRFKSFKLLTIIGVGLIDGINPCAFTVIVFFISFLALQGYKRKELIVIGLSFIFSVFIVYLLIGIGAFSFLYRLKGFLVTIKIINLFIGVFSIFLGFAAFYDFLKFKKTGETKDLILQLPKTIKVQIHKVIRMHHKVGTKDEAASPKKHIFGLVVSALVTGFLISLLEAVCTGQTYLPIIAFILKTTDLKLQAFLYLVVYNFMFVVPLIGIFIFALFGTTSTQFSDFLKKHLSLIKVFMALLFFSLGVFLILRA